jgi:hypothetical protein
MNQRHYFSNICEITYSVLYNTHCILLCRLFNIPEIFSNLVKVSMCKAELGIRTTISNTQYTL